MLLNLDLQRIKLTFGFQVFECSVRFPIYDPPYCRFSHGMRRSQLLPPAPGGHAAAVTVRSFWLTMVYIKRR